MRRRSKFFSYAIKNNQVKEILCYASHEEKEKRKEIQQKNKAFLFQAPVI